MLPKSWGLSELKTSSVLRRKTSKRIMNLVNSLAKEVLEKSERLFKRILRTRELVRL